jgi:hypothetical protein
MKIPPGYGAAGFLRRPSHTEAGELFCFAVKELQS